MRTITKTVYTIEEHPNKENVYNWIRENWHDLNYHSLEEVVDSLKALQKVIGGYLDWSISTVEDRGEFIRFSHFDKEELNNLNEDDLPLTGVCWDYEAIKGLKDGDPELVLRSLHEDTEYIYSDQGLFELCEANGYEFYESGKIV